ncbi:prolyl oligopeptidase family serine peptidase [Paraglaciecola sp. 20A4]|uniref:alpha/beta hydrolase family protein n=1 Tax=Paraglaciecola sp. 20A4 TaxID=2687288 RepID=UPI00197D6FD8|nr:prolyl oligopeptidase family serine peptidase [Paraglaciecola sp. 20A4]
MQGITIITKAVFFLSLVLCCSSTYAQNWDDLFDDAKYQDVKLSPDGGHIAVAMMSEGKRVLVFLNRTSMELAGSLNLSGKNEVGEYYWANNERVVIKINQKVAGLREARFFGELYAIDYDGTRGSIIYGYRAGESQIGTRIQKQKETRGWANIIDLLPEEPNHILISSTPWSDSGDRVADINKIDIYKGLLKERVAISPVITANFLTNENGQLTVAYGTDKDFKRQVYILQDGDWQKIPNQDFGSAFTPLTVGTDNSYLYALDNLGQDKTGLFKFDLKSGESNAILTDEKVDITSVSLTTDGRNIYGLRVDDGFPAYYMLNTSLPEAKVFKSLLATFPGESVDITSHSNDGSLYTLLVSSDIDAGSFFIYDKTANALTFLFKKFPKLNSDQMAMTDPFSFTTDSGHQLNGYFTQAKTAKNAEIAPLVVVVHGGPHIRNYWTYSAQTQFLALNGYSVLQVNFSGSTGYGKSFEKAAYGEWGTLIQQDIYDAYLWAIQQGKALKDKACIMGGSFGGYSAIQSIINYPTTYQCAISNAGVYDLEMMFEEGDIVDRSWGSRYLETTLGKDKEHIRSMSPVYHADKIQVPVFLAHGEQDQRAPIEQLERLKDALDKNDKEYEFYGVSAESHGFYDPENQKAYMNKVVTFLNKHL